MASTLSDAWSLIHSGKYRHALEVLHTLSPTNEQQVLQLIVDAEMNPQPKQSDKAKKLIAKTLSASEKALCHSVVGRADVRFGRVDEGLKSLRDSVALAVRANDATLVARLQALLVGALLHWAGIEAALPELPRLYRYACIAGDAISLIEFHCANAEAEMKRGGYSNSRRHLRVGESLADEFPNLVLVSRIHRLKANLAILWSWPLDGMQSAKLAVRMARESGSHRALFASLSTLAHVGLLAGDLAVAKDAVSQMLAFDLTEHEGIAARDALLQIAIARGDFVEAERIASKLEIPKRSGATYLWLWHVLSRAKLVLAEGGQVSEALTLLTDCSPQVVESGDQKLAEAYDLMRSELLAACGERLDAARFFARAVKSITPLSPQNLLEINKLAGKILGTTSAAGKLFAQRAENLSILILSRSGTHSSLKITPITSALEALHSVITLFALAANPELLGYEIVMLFEATEAASDGAFEKQRPDGTHTLCYSFGRPFDGSRRSDSDIQFTLGEQNGFSYSVRVTPRQTPECRILAVCVELLLTYATGWSQSRDARPENPVIWDSKVYDAKFGMIVSSERMAEIINVTRRVAASNVTVLFTGETGTGKELLARALHEAPCANNP